MSARRGVLSHRDSAAFDEPPNATARDPDVENHHCRSEKSSKTPNTATAVAPSRQATEQRNYSDLAASRRSRTRAMAAAKYIYIYNQMSIYIYIYNTIYI